MKEDKQRFVGPPEAAIHKFVASERMLTQQLRELEDEGIFHRKVYPVVPPKVEYSLTAYGRTLRPITDLVCKWGETHLRRLKGGAG